MRALRAIALASLVAAIAVVASPREAHAQFHDPRLVWETLESRHFRITFHQGLRPMAQRIADVGEGVYQAVGDLMGWHPVQIVRVLLSDNTDDSNGSANAIPYNVVRLYATSPEDLSELSDYDDYPQQLLTHEFTHIAHLDNIHGIPALINAIFGKIYPPNAAEPAWILEGIAVYSETRFTTGGRLRAGPWHMAMRADALANHFVTLDQLSSGGANRWPHGQSVYLYGSYFIQYIADRFGPDTIARIATDYGQQLIPAAINRSIYHATGHTYEELYPEFLAAMRERFEHERDDVVVRGLIEGEPLTHQGERVFYPRFLPDGHTVMFESDDGRSHAQLRTVDTRSAPGVMPRSHDGDWIEAFSGFALDSGGRRMVLSDVGFYRQIYFFRELYQRDVELRDGRAITTNNHVITDDARAQYPDFSPDDDHVAFIANHRGTQQLWEMSLAERVPAPVFRVPRGEQVYTPRYSPDGRRIAFSQWQRGGYRDIRIIDRTTLEIAEVTHDRALDMQPIWSPDGRYLVWSSDRSGIPNLYALDLETHEVKQITNVRTGAYMPAISPDGHTLVYAGYSTYGWDLYRMPFDPTRWIEASPPPPPPNATALPTPPTPTRIRPYNAWDTLHPWFYGLDYGSDGFGPQVGIFTTGGDLVGNHAYSARLAFGLTRGDPSFDVSYQYAGMRPTLNLHLYRSVVANRFRIGNTDVTYPEDRWGGESSVSVYFPALFASNAISLSYEAQYVQRLSDLPFNRLADPNEPPNALPFQGWTSGLRASWSFSRVIRPTYAISSQEGYSAALSIHGTDRALGSAAGSFDVSAAAAGYLPMPWGYPRRPHILALRVAGGLGIADDGARAIYYLGGFPTYSFTDFISSFLSLSSSGGVALRGYPQFARAGDSFFLCNVEYRFPIVQVDHGVSTLPVYLSRLYGSVALDVGSAFFGRIRPEDVAVGAAVELLADVIVGWYFSYTVRLGLAQGFTGSDAMLQPYVLLSAPF